MTVFRSAVIATISFFAAGLLDLSPSSYAGDPMIREAVTRSSPANVSRYADDLKSVRKRGRLGFAPLPFQPAPSVAKQGNGLVGHSGLADIRGLVRKVNRSVVSIRMLDSGSSWSLGNFGISKGESDVKATSDEPENGIWVPPLISGYSVSGILLFYFSSFFPDE